METEWEVVDAGEEHGYNIASWIDLPDAYTTIPREFDFIGHGTVDSLAAAEDYFHAMADAAETNARQYSDFVPVANELNELEAEDDTPFEPWETFDHGIGLGIEKNWDERKDYYEGDFD